VGRHLLAAALARPGAGALAVATGTRAAPGSLRREGDAWLVSTHPKPEPGKSTTTQHRVVVAAGSATSTFNVINPVAPALAAAAGAVRADACWGLLVAFATPLFGDAGCVADGVLVSGSSSLAWFARNSSKPGRQSGSGADCWVVHAMPSWSNERRELKADAVAQALLQEFRQACGLAATPPTVHVEAFLWNAAFPLNPASPAEDCFADASLRLAMAGDWCIGPRAGDAWASGVAAAHAVLRDML
jgi:predicted NAD/FAD-dependent oxidoreductase